MAKSEKKHHCLHSPRCVTHPQPDQLGRQVCDVCGCFTIDPDGRHGWCKSGRYAPGPYLKQWKDQPKNWKPG